YLYTLRQDKGGIPLRAERCTGPAFTLITARQPKCESELDTELADERARTGSAAITRAAPVNSHFILEVKEPLRHVCRAWIKTDPAHHSQVLFEAHYSDQIAQTQHRHPKSPELLGAFRIYRKDGRLGRLKAVPAPFGFLPKSQSS